MTVLYFIIILGILVLVHELGHFVVARLSGVAVEEFGFGFPPRIVGWRRGSTIFSFNWIPFGGFVRLQGEQEDTAKRRDSFVSAPFPRQFAILAAGVLMNALLAWALLSGTLIAGVSTDSTAVPHDRYAILSSSRVEAVVTDGSPAAAAGLKNGDHVLTIDGQSMTTTDDIINDTKSHNYPTIDIVVLRNGSPMNVHVTPRASVDHPRYGFGIQSVTTVRYPWYIAGWYGFGTTAQMVSQTLIGFGHLLKDFVTTAHVSQDVTGPVGIAVLTGQVIQYGFTATLQFMAILSISLAVVNFLPLPALDGGRAVFVIIARIRRKPVDPQVEGAIHAIGFYVLLFVIILLSIRDISRYQLIDQLRKIFQ